MGAGCSTGRSDGPIAERPSLSRALRASFDPLREVRSRFEFEKVLDKGSTCVVHQVCERATGERYACKSISKMGLTKAEVEEARLEVAVLRHLGSHPHIAEVVALYEDRTDIHIVMQLCTGGELFRRLASGTGPRGGRGGVSEAEAARCISVVVRVVHHCHTMNVCHRDIKPENFLLESPSSPLWQLRAIDFGSSCFVADDATLTQVVGSPYYVAPEVLRGEYGREADVWSAGVLAYILLVGRPPFDGDNDEQVLLRILSAPLDLRTGAWASVSPDARDLVRRMLTRNPRRRITAEQVLHHAWVRHHCGGSGVQTPSNGTTNNNDANFSVATTSLDTPIVVPELLLRMRAYAGMGEVRKQALKVCARMLPESELVGLREVFASIDRDADGTVSLPELLAALRRRGARDVGEAEVGKLLVEVSGAGAGKAGDLRLRFDDFVAATLHPSMLQRSEVLMSAFRAIDTEGTGTIDQVALEALLVREGYLHDSSGRGSGGRPRRKSAMTMQDYAIMLEGVDKNGDGLIDYSEFCAMLLQRDQRFPGGGASTPGATAGGRSGSGTMPFDGRSGVSLTAPSAPSSTTSPASDHSTTTTRTASRTGLAKAPPPPASPLGTHPLGSKPLSHLGSSELYNGTTRVSPKSVLMLRDGHGSSASSASGGSERQSPSPTERCSRLAAALVSVSLDMNHVSAPLDHSTAS